MRLAVHSKTDCPYCAKAKEFLKGNDIPFDEFIYDDYDARQRMYDGLGLQGRARTVPQIVITENDGSTTLVGGYSDLMNSDILDRFNAGRFDADF